MRKTLLIVILFTVLLSGVAMAQATTSVSIPDVEGKPGETVMVPVNIEGASNIGGMSISLEYDISILSPVDVEKGPLTSEALLESNTNVPGEVAIAWVDTEGISGDGSVAIINFNVNGKPGETCLLTLAAVEAADADTLVDIILTIKDGTFTVVQAASSISCSTSKSTIKKGESITVSGLISPPREGVTVTLTYKAPDDSILTRTTTTTEAGTYSDTYTPEKVGSWSMEASWDGDIEYTGSESPPKSFTVEKKGLQCIIATATYGSELTPEVQFLRGFRDNLVLSTFAGSKFMHLFNALYYSFSPSVAVFIASQPLIKMIMKGVLYPLIGILCLSSITYSAFSFSPELGVIMAGLVASALIGAIYFSPPAAVLLAILKRLRKKTLNIRQLKPLAILWLISLASMLIGEITISSTSMMIAAGSFVLITLCTSAILLASKIVQRLL